MVHAYSTGVGASECNKSESGRGACVRRGARRESRNDSRKVGKTATIDYIQFEKFEKFLMP